MKRYFLIFLLITIIFSAVHAQRVPVIGVMEFETYGSGVTQTDAQNITRQVISELSSWGTLNVLQGNEGAEYVIRGTIAKQGNQFVLTAATFDTRTENSLNTYREQINIDNISLFAFCAKALERVPFPNYLIGTWQSAINMPDGPVVCIMEFRSDRTIRVERYDTWEHKQNNALRYEGYGRGTYYYAGYANRTVNLSSGQVRIDATVNISLNLEETLPEQTNVNQTSLFLVFNGDKSAFDIINGILPCGQNYDGPSVYSSATLGFNSFTKIR